MEASSGKVGLVEGFVDVQAELDLEAKLEALKASKAAVERRPSPVHERTALFERTQQHTQFENGVLMHCNALEEAANSPFNEKLYMHSLGAIHTKFKAMTHISKAFYKELNRVLTNVRDLAKGNESVILGEIKRVLEDTSSKSGHDVYKTNRVLTGVDTYGRSLKLYKLEHIRPQDEDRAASVADQKRASEHVTKGGARDTERADPRTPSPPLRAPTPPPPSQPAVREAILKFDVGTSSFPLLKMLCALSPRDSNALMQDRDTGPAIEKIFLAAINELSDTEFTTMETQLDAISAANLILRHPKSEFLFPPHEFCPTGSSVFAARLLRNVLPISEELQILLQHKPETTSALRLLYSEASLFAVQAFPKLLHEMTDREVISTEELAGPIRADITACMNLAQNFPVTLMFLGKMQPEDITTGYALIIALEYAYGTDETDMATAGLGVDFKSKCLEFSKAIGRPVKHIEDATVADFEGLSKEIHEHREATFKGTAGKKKMPPRRIHEVLSMLVNVKRFAETIRPTLGFDNALRTPIIDSIRRANDVTSTFIKFVMMENFDSRGDSKAALAHHLQNELSSMTEISSYPEISQRTARVQRIIRARFDPLEKESLRLRQISSHLEEVANAKEFARLRARSTLEKHDYSQFNRPTVSKGGTWWPADVVTRENLGSSPADSACSCNAALALIYSLTPGKIDTPHFPFDRVMDDAQQIYYQLADTDPTFEAGISQDCLSGCYLRLEDLKRHIIDPGYLQIVEGEERYIKESLMQGYEHISYKSIFTNLERKIVEDVGSIGGLIQNGASIYALIVEKDVSGSKYTVIDSHGLYHGIQTLDENQDLDRAFKITFESIDDVTSFLQLHHPHTGSENYATNTVTVLPVKAPEFDLSVLSKGKDLLSTIAATSINIDEQRLAKKAKNRGALVSLGILPKTYPPSGFKLTSSLGGAKSDIPKAEPSSARVKDTNNSELLKQMVADEDQGNVSQAFETAQELLIEKKLSPIAMQALKGFSLACERRSKEFKLHKNSQIALKGLTVDQKILDEFSSPGLKPDRRAALYDLMWKGYRTQTLELARQHI